MIRGLIFLGVVLSGLQGFAPCQVMTIGDLPALPSRAEIGSRDETIRMTAYAKLIGVSPKNYFSSGIYDVASVLQETLAKKPEVAETRKALLIELLENENKIVRSYRHPSLQSKEGRELTDTEGYSNYLGDLIWAVSSLHDVRSMKALLGVLASGGMATRTVISFGKVAVNPVLKKMQDPDSLIRAIAVQMLPQMLEVRDISKDTATKLKIRKALIQAAKDKRIPRPPGLNRRINKDWRCGMHFNCGEPCAKRSVSS